MNLVDSCGWLEYFANGPNADFFADPIEKVEELLVPTICILEVFKKVLQEREKGVALQAITAMMSGKQVDLDTSIAINAAMLGVENKLPMADSVILATARLNGAVIWTQDKDFKNLDGVKYIPR